MADSTTGKRASGQNKRQRRAEDAFAVATRDVLLVLYEGGYTPREAVARLVALMQGEVAAVLATPPDHPPAAQNTSSRPTVA